MKHLVPAALSFALLLILVPAALPQTAVTDDAADKDKKDKEFAARMVAMLDQCVQASGGLRIAQNRAVADTVVGDLYWNYDIKRARELFRSAAAELITNNVDSERERALESQPSMLFYVSDIRTEIIPLIAHRDAVLALEILYQTRPQRLTDAMARYGDPTKRAADTSMVNPDKTKVSQEIALEQRVALLAADADPDLAIKQIKDSLAKGISFNVIPLLQKLNKNDEKKAADLAADVIHKIVDADLAKSDDDMRMSINVLQYAARPPSAMPGGGKPFAFADNLARDLANKIASSFAQQTNRSSLQTSMLNQALPMLEKLAPERAAQLKQRQSDGGEGSLSPDMKRLQDQQKLYDPTASPEDTVAQIAKMSEFERSMVYPLLDNKLAGITDDARAKSIIDQIPDEAARQAASEQYDARKIARMSQAGKLDDARKAIASLTDHKLMIQRYVDLALTYQKRGTDDDKAAARDLMREARSLVVDPAQTNDEISDAMQVVSGFIKVDTDTAFAMATPLIDRMNEYMQAMATLSTFGPQSGYRKGEMLMTINGNTSTALVGRYKGQLQAFAAADLDRTQALVDRFSRPDSQLLARLYILQAIIKNPPKPALPAAKPPAQ